MNIIAGPANPVNWILDGDGDALMVALDGQREGINAPVPMEIDDREWFQHPAGDPEGQRMLDLAERLARAVIFEPR